MPEIRSSNDTPLLTTVQMDRAAKRFASLFPVDSFSRWSVCGAARRGEQAADCWHLVSPFPDTTAPDPAWAALGVRLGPPLWNKLDQLCAAGEISRLYLPEAGYVWHSHLRLIVHGGTPHWIMTARACNWGLAEMAATGPDHFMERVIARLAARRYTIAASLLLHGRDGKRVDVPDELAVFRLAGLEALQPAARSRAGRGYFR